MVPSLGHHHAHARAHSYPSCVEIPVSDAHLVGSSLAGSVVVTGGTTTLLPLKLQHHIRVTHEGVHRGLQVTH